MKNLLEIILTNDNDQIIQTIKNQKYTSIFEYSISNIHENISYSKFSNEYVDILSLTINNDNVKYSILNFKKVKNNNITIYYIIENNHCKIIILQYKNKHIKIIKTISQLNKTAIINKCVIDQIMIMKLLHLN